MVFIVVSNVERDVVERAVVAIGLVALLEHVVLRDEVASNRM